jgi:hypothetical protein
MLRSLLQHSRIPKEKRERERERERERNNELFLNRITRVTDALAPSNR